MYIFVHMYIYTIYVPICTNILEFYLRNMFHNTDVLLTNALATRAGAFTGGGAVFRTFDWASRF